MAPGFDRFADALVGAWRGPGAAAVDVAEVMRACGGAVQGVEDNGAYHNRADDGFVYFDCGSYSAGPVAAAGALATCLTFASGKRQLVVMDVCPDEPLRGASPSALQLQRGAAPATVPDASVARAADPTDRAAPPPLALLGELGCRMASPTQPWILQRAQWEERRADAAAGAGTWGGHPADGVEYVEGGGGLWGWVASRDVWASGAWADGEATVLQVGAVDLETGEAKAVVRAYTRDGRLASVVLQRGRGVQG